MKIGTLADAKRELDSKPNELNTIRECILALVDFMEDKNKKINELVTQKNFDAAMKEVFDRLDKVDDKLAKLVDLAEATDRRLTDLVA